MSRTDQYQRILDELADGELDELQAKVFHFLRKVYPASLTRRELIDCIYGYRPADEEDLNNNTDDRKIRTAISTMFELGVPVVSTSGGAGYRIDIDMNSWNDMIVELQGKKKSFERKIEAAQRIVMKIQTHRINAIPTNVPATPRQLSFVDGAR